MTRLTKQSLFVTVILLALFLSVLLRNEPKLQTPLANMGIESVTPKNATLISAAPIVKDTLKDNVKAGSYILQGTIEIPANAAVQVEPGTVFYANRDAKIIVHGKLTADKTTWLSNQEYSQRQYWYGIVAEQAGKVDLIDNKIQDATTAITAQGGGQASISGTIAKCVVGLATLEKGKIVANNLTINDGTVGIMTLGGNTVIDNVTFDHVTDGLRVFHGSAISINGPKFLNINKFAIRYLAEPNLLITNLNAKQPLPPDSILDGKTQPTHNWNGLNYKTGFVIFTNIK